MQFDWECNIEGTPPSRRGNVAYFGSALSDDRPLMIANDVRLCFLCAEANSARFLCSVCSSSART